MSLLNQSNCLLLRFLLSHKPYRHHKGFVASAVTNRLGLMKYSKEKILNPSDKMTEILKLKFPLAKHIEVVDVSGGCGSMYEIYVESVEFKGLSMVKQHRLINEVLKEDIKQMHGLRIQTKVPKENT